VRPAPRLYIDAPLGEGAQLLSPEHARYLGQVLRLKEGAEVHLFNARDGEWIYTITAMNKRGGEAEAQTQRRPPEPAAEAPILFFAPVKRTQTEFLVQKATELGVAQLQPVITARTIRESLRIDRFESIAIEAAEQSERLSIPSISEPIGLNGVINGRWPFVFCDEAGNQTSEPRGGADGRAPLAPGTFQQSKQNPQGLLIGPEGGFTPEERDALRACQHALPVSLGPRILRAETAAIVALTLWQASYGDLSSISS